MRAKYLPYVIVGILFIYVSMYGLEGFGLSLTGDALRQDWNSLTGWNAYNFVGTNTIEVGTLKQQGATPSGTFSRACIELNPFSPPKPKFTVEFSLKLDSFPSSNSYTSFQMYYNNDGGGYTWLCVYFTPAGYSLDGSNITGLIHDFNVWHIWTICVDSTVAANGASFWKDATKLASFTPFKGSGSTNPRVSHETDGQATVHYNYLYIDSGLKEPGTGPGPSTGTLSVSASYQGSSVSVYVTAAGPETKSGTTPVTFTLAPGSYTVSGTYQGITKSETATVTAGQTASVALNFGGASVKGTLRVFASYQAAYVAVAVTISGPESSSGTTTTDGNYPLSLQLSAGSYTVSGTYSGISRSGTATVTAGQSSDVTLNFGGDSPPPPPPSFDIIALIRKALANPTVKQILLLGGLGMAGIGGIMLVLPEKRYYPPPAPHY